MGRVRRYRRIKAIDPFSKRGKGGLGDGVEHELPPDRPNHIAQRFNEDGTRKRKKRPPLPLWIREELKNTAKDDDGEAELAIDPSRKKAEEGPPRMKPRGADESLKQFNQRIKRETAQMLIDEAKASSATVKKKKLYLQEKKKQKKLKKQQRIDEAQSDMRRKRSARGSGGDMEENNDGSDAEGRPRVRHRRRDGDGGGDDDAFPAPERIAFGEVVHEPPRFTVKPKLRGMAAAVASRGDGPAAQKPWVKHKLRVPDQDEGTAGLAAIAGGDAGGAAAGMGAGIRAGESEETARLKRQYHEAMLNEATAAYAALKKRRRGGATQVIGGNL